jgi:hypothetical protein
MHKLLNVHDDFRPDIIETYGEQPNHRYHNKTVRQIQENLEKLISQIK